MAGMLIAGIVCLVAAAIAAYLFYDSRKTLQAVQGTETLKCGDVTQLSQAASEAVGPGSFSHGCEVVGTAMAPETGQLTAPESKLPCVWHKTEVKEHYYEYRRDSNGNRRRHNQTRTLSSYTSETPFLIDDGSGRVPVLPQGAEIDGEEKVVDRMERDVNKASGLLGLANIAFSFGDHTTGVEYTESILRPGARLYVLGEVSDRRGEVQLGKPSEGGPMIISTRSEEEIVSSKRGTIKWSRIGMIVLIPAGLVLVVLGLVL